MDEKKALALRISVVEKQLAKQRRNWFLGIWLGYTAITYCNVKFIEYSIYPREFDYLLEFLFADLFNNTLLFFVELLISAVLGLIAYVINLSIWSNCSRSINDTVSVYERLVKEYNEMP